MAVNFRLRSKTHLAILFMSIATVIFVIHEMLATINDSSVAQMSEASIKDARRQLWFKGENTKDELNGEFIKENEETQTKTEPFLGEKLVHLDLKGAPPKLSFYKELFPYLKTMGATGILMEYEDMFPYSGQLQDIMAYNAYNLSEIKEILKQADDNGLTIMPLIQSFGHLEFVLKLSEYRELREVDRYPQVICPTHLKTADILEEIISQVLKLHPNTKYLHIGSDEVYYIGQCGRCIKLMEEKQWTKTQLFLDHVKHVAKMVHKHGVVPVMWDDEFRGVSEELVLESGVDQLVEIMVWKYTLDVTYAITPEILDKYSRLFKSIWIASAFKGATGPAKEITDIRHHLANHVSWMHLVSRWKDQIQFKGIAITGWQRYDHFAVLCELLPLGIPSLTISLLYINGQTIHEKTLSNILNCDFQLSLSQNAYSGLEIPASLSCSFPGSSIYHTVQRYHSLLVDIANSVQDVGKGWFTKYNIDHAFSSPANVESATMFLDHHMMELRSIEHELRRCMPDVYDDFTIDEWVAIKVTPLLRRIQRLREARDVLLEQVVWPRRPLNTTILTDGEAYPFT